MHFRSLTTRLLVIIGTVFIATQGGTLFVGNRQLKRVIDSSQENLYREKLSIIRNELLLADEQYREDGGESLHEIQSSVLKTLYRTYYSDSIKSGFPVIVDGSMRVLLHPSLPEGTALGALVYPDIIDSYVPDEGQHLRKVAGVERWFLYSKFKQWDWILVYSVPLSEKYRDLRTFSIMMTVLALMSCFIFFPLLIIILLRAARPVGELTRISGRIASGYLDDPVPVRGKDEVSILAGSFRDMQRSIKDKIEAQNREIAERKRVESELSGAKDFISSIIESMPSVLICVDTDERVTHWNSRAAELTNVGADAAVGKPLEEVFPELESESLMIQTGINAGEAQFFPQRVRKVDDNIFYDDITVYPMAGVQGAVIRIDDVTEKTIMEEHLLQANKMDAIGQLAGGVAHDFNNMLAGITGAASLLQLSENLEGKDRRKYIDLILDASKRAAGLTSKLLTFGSNNKFKQAAMDLHTVISDSLSLLERTIDRKVTIVADFQAERTLISGDVSAIQNAVMNLAINAAHAMNGNGTLKVETKNVYLDELYCRMSPFNLKPGDFIILSVSDTGEGIPPELMTKIFEPFYTTKEQGKGTGLGLSSVYGTMQNHNGAVKVYSERGKGSVFHLYFPCSERSSSVADAPGKMMRKGSGTVLLADDEQMIRLTVKPLLERMGYTVLLAEDGEEAVAVYKREQEDIILVITDMIMPKMNGREVFYSVQGINPLCPVIISSGFTRDENLDSLLDEGLAGFIQKPFLNDELATLLDRVLGTD